MARQADAKAAIRELPQYARQPSRLGATAACSSGPAIITGFAWLTAVSARTPARTPQHRRNILICAPSVEERSGNRRRSYGGSVRILCGSSGHSACQRVSVLPTAVPDGCPCGLTALWPQDRGSGLHGPALPDRDFRDRASSNSSSNIVSDSGSTDFVEDLVRLQAEAAGDDFFLDLGGAAEDRLDAAELLELTIVAESSGLVLPAGQGGLHRVSASRGVRAKGLGLMASPRPAPRAPAEVSRVMASPRPPARASADVPPGQACADDGQLSVDAAPTHPGASRLQAASASPPCCNRVGSGRSLTSPRIVSASRRTWIQTHRRLSRRKRIFPGPTPGNCLRERRPPRFAIVRI